MSRLCYYDPEIGFVPYPDIPEEKHMTNADRIRAMSDEELALWKRQECPDNPRPCLKVHYRVDCTSCWLDWLRQEADE